MKLLRTFLQEDGSRRYAVVVPDFIYEREDFPTYEKDRFLSMEMNLKKGDVLFDVGAECGWMSAIYASFVGAENMCLFEPSVDFWPTVKEVWDVNDLALPRAVCQALVSNRTYGNALDVVIKGWPKAAFGTPMTAGYENWTLVHAFTNANYAIAEISLDDFSQQYGIVPNAITLDVDGGEGRVLRGAARILAEHRPLVWASLHAEVRLEKYNTSKAKIRSFIRDAGYLEHYLGVDHEEHAFFYPKERIGQVALVDSPWKTNGTRNTTFEEKIPDWIDPWNAEKADWGVDD